MFLLESEKDVDEVYSNREIKINVHRFWIGRLAGYVVIQIRNSVSSYSGTGNIGNERKVIYNN